MKRILLALAAACGLHCTPQATGAPVTVKNPSFEIQATELTSGQWTDNLEPDWKETGGPNSPNAFMEWLGLTGEDGTDTLGMVAGQDVWQDLAASYEPNKVYTLTVKVGNRSGLTVAGNQSTYGLAGTQGQYLASRAVDASTHTAAGTFLDAPALVFDTFSDPCVTGPIRVLLQARGVNRSHFDHIRLDVTDSAPAGRPAASLLPAENITPAAALLKGTVTSSGSADPSVVFYYDTSDKGSNPAAWASSVTIPGTQSGAFSAPVTGLLPNTAYVYRARVTNASGAVWAAPCLSFTTLSAPPAVENVAATAVGGSMATIGAAVTATGGAAPQVTIYYGAADGGTNPAAWASSLSIPSLSGTATRALSGLTPATVYYFRAFAQNSGGSDWADSSISFTTLPVNPPAVENRAADNITGTSAVLNGEVTATGNDAPVVTLYWGTADGGNNAAAWTNSRVLGTDSGNFGSMVQGLAALTKYYFTAKAVNAAGEAWASPSRNFTTGNAFPVSVIINEIHYDPVDPTIPEEFIEFHNPTAAAIDLSGWILDQGVEFVFPAGTTIAAGGYKIVAQNPAALAAKFPTAAGALGPWTGTLSNSGENIRLRNAAGNTVDEVDYKAGFPWPTAAKGTGVSCELIHPSLNNDLGGNWRAGFVPVGVKYVPLGSSWRWRRGVVGDTGETAGKFTTWRDLNFVEPSPAAANAQWATNNAPFGYGENDGIAGETENVTPLPDMISGGTLPDYTSIYMRKVFTIAPGKMPAYLQVKARVDDGCIVWINGVYVGAIRPNATVGTGHHYYSTLAVNSPEPPPLDLLPLVSAAQVNLVEGDNVIAIHAMNTTANSSDFFIDAEVSQSFGTTAGLSPNLANTNLTDSASKAPPVIRGVDHSPSRPVAGEAVLITATITDPDAVGPVTLSYQGVNPGSYIRRQDAAYTNPANWTTLAMNDAGTGGDKVAGDGVFSATIPATEQTHRRLVRYRIAAEDSLANSVTVPYADDEQPNFAYFVYNGVPDWTGAFRPATFAGFPATAPQTFPASLISSIEPFHLIALDADVASCLYTGPADSTTYNVTFVYEGKVYDHVKFNVRGIGSTRVSGKNKMAFKFNRARDFRGRDNWGRQYQEDWNSFGLDANASPWAAMNRGSAGVEVAASYRVFELAGMNSLRTSYAHLRIIRKAAESAPAGTTVTDTTAGGSVDGQYTSDLMGLYMVLEPTEANFIDERHLPDGNLYAIEGNNGDKKYQAANQVSDGSDWTAYRTGRTLASQTETWYRSNMDLPNLYNYIALSRLIGNVDVRDGDNYRYYHRSSDNRWVIVPYDHDMQFIAAAHWVSQTTVDGVVSAGIPHSYAAIKRHPAIALEYRNRCRELLGLLASDATASGGQIGQLFDEYAQMVNPSGQALTWADLDANMWNLHPRSAGAGANNGQTNHRGNFFRSVFTDARGAGTGSVASTYLRNLPDPDGDGFSDHEGLVSWFRDYATNTYPAVGAGVVPWTRRPVSSPVSTGAGADTYIHRQKGYGYKYLEWESLYGGHFAAFINPTAGVAIGDLTAAGTSSYTNNGASLATLSASSQVLYPDQPSVTYSGTAGYPVNDLRFHSGSYRDPQNDAITAVQWRVAEISAPGIPLYDPSRPRIYEIEELWRSAELPAASATDIADVRIPGGVVRAGHTYRARVRHRDSTGRWSFWSEPVQFVAGLPDVTAFSNALRISEINYNPGAVQPAESAAPGWNVLWNEQDFEFIEVRNISTAAVDMTDVRFTKGINFDFPAGYSLAAGASAVIVKNPAAFAIRYPSVVPAGNYGADNLSNSGEEIKLSYGAGAQIIGFTYGDSNTALWPAAPDGSGPTLVLTTPTKPGLNHGDPAEWRASNSSGGNPGGSGGMTYAQWAGSDPGLADPAADNDHDGYDNRLEYALSGNTAGSSTSRAPVASFSSDGGQDFATLTFTRRTDAGDVIFNVQFSDELMSWNLPASLISRTVNGDGTQTEIWRSLSPVSTTGRTFGRVEIRSVP